MDTVTEEEASFQPGGFNNTIRWLTGHVYSVAEKFFLFQSPEHPKVIPDYYPELFGMGTRPSEWNREAPTLSELKQQLTFQKERIEALPAALWAEQAPFHFAQRELYTYGDMFGMALYHEANHLGHMQSIKRLANK